MKFIMLAKPGERHEDCVPEGLFTITGFESQMRSYMEPGVDNDGVEFYVFIMTPDSKPSWKFDCNHTITIHGRGFVFDDDYENPITLAEIIHILKSQCI